MSAITVMKGDLESESHGSQRRGDGNTTMTSNFSMGTVDVEDLRQQLAAASIDLEDQKL
jgi:hypothetical protein